MVQIIPDLLACNAYSLPYTIACMGLRNCSLESNWAFKFEGQTNHNGFLFKAKHLPIPKENFSQKFQKMWNLQLF